jgi:hypothetical protein
MVPKLLFDPYVSPFGWFSYRCLTTVFLFKTAEKVFDGISVYRGKWWYEGHG